MISPNPYAVIGAAEAAALLLDALARRLNAHIPDAAREGLLALLEEALTASRDGDLDDASTLTDALIRTITRRWTHADVRDAA